MRLFTKLYRELDRTNKTNEKVAAMRKYFAAADPSDAAWALYFLSGRKPKRIVPSGKLRDWTIELSGFPAWMFEECRNMVGDISETVALLLPEGLDTIRLADLVENRLLPLRFLDEDGQRESLASIWPGMGRTQRFVFNKLIAGNFRAGVSQKLVMRALSLEFEVPVDIIALRLVGEWTPSGAFFESIIDQDLDDEDPIARPYPFHSADPFDSEKERAAELGDPKDWQIEWKYDGIRCQAIKRKKEVFLWSTDEDMITDLFPEVTGAAVGLPDGTVIDGEILPFKANTIMHFSDLERRTGRKTVSKKILTEVPVILMCYDLLEHEGKDIRTSKLAKRRALLENLFDNIPDDSNLKLTRPVEGKNWSEIDKLRQKSRTRRVEGVMLKHRRSPYRMGRHRGDWWKWKVAPLTADAVLVYAQKGTGRNADLFTDYTFAVWKGNELVPIAKAYSGLTNSEIKEIDRFVKQNTRESFGPVRSVEPKHVFELTFEGIQESKRRKSGVALRAPIISCWKRDKNVEEADSLDTVRLLLKAYEPEEPK